MPKEMITSYRIIYFGSPEIDNKGNYIIRQSNFRHTGIIFHTTHGRVYTYEWGNETKNNIIKNKNDGSYSYTGENGKDWIGMFVDGNVVFHDDENIISLSDVEKHAEKWYETHEAGGSYPSNCRGYVDSVLTELFDEPPFTKELEKGAVYRLRIDVNKPRENRKRKAPSHLRGGNEYKICQKCNRPIKPN